MARNKTLTLILLPIAAVLLVGLVYVELCRTGQFSLSLADLRQKYTTPTSKFVTIRGVEIHYKDEGTGPVVVLFHGSFGNLRTYDGVVEEMKDHYRLIRMDIAPWGLSGNISDEVAKSGIKFPDVVKGLLDQLQISHVSVAGVSSGGTESFRFASAYPEMVDALILSNTPSFFVPTPTSPPIIVNTIKLTNFLHYKPNWVWNIWLHPLFVDQSKVTPELVAQYTDFNRRVPSPNNRALVPFLGVPPVDQPFIDAQFARITAPTLLMWIPADPELPLPTMDALKARLKNAKEVREIVVPGVGHYLPLEAPHPFAQNTMAFLQSLGIS